MDLDSLKLNPGYIAPSAWWQHVPVAHWLVNVLKPSTIVELGTHYGVSFFAFCEAVEAFSPNSFVYAVDTWEGDAHSGSHSEDVYKRVLTCWSESHRSRSRLVRSTFDDAATHFAKGSIDILHIDGLHTYEAVKHDFETWLPLLNEESIVLFHDINVRERDFGVWELWQQLKGNPDYSTAEVLNGHGLGILAKGLERKQLLLDSSSIFPLLIAKGELLEKIAELTPGGSFEKSVLQIKAEQAKAEAEQAKAEAEQARSLLVNLTSSKAWRLTYPIRKMADLLRF
jgi:predicted O-methyltransferase YrrM